jgi:hypothetical protein
MTFKAARRSWRTHLGSERIGKAASIMYFHRRIDRPFMVGSVVQVQSYTKSNVVALLNRLVQLHH